MKTNSIAECRQDKIMRIVVSVIMILLVILIVYPLIYVVACSLSSGKAVTNGKVILWPVDFTLEGYKLALSYKSVWVGFRNTLFYTVVGTAFNLLLTICAAYPLSRKNLQGKKIYLAYFMITMFFWGGLIPDYICMTKLHLTNTKWAIILDGALSIYNMIIMKTFFENSIPGELLEAAKIDGITDFGYLFKVVIPLSKAILAVIILYYAVTRWNSYFTGMIYLRDKELYPLQLVLREILNAGRIDASQVKDKELLAKIQGMDQVMNYALMVITSLPILMAYPFVQRYFEKGVMIGSVKG